MNIALFGATGGVGRQVMSQALQAGHTLTVGVRSSSTFTLQHPQLRVEVGNVLDRDWVTAVIAGQDAVLSTLGPNGRGPTSLCTDAVANMLAAMAHHNVNRIVVVSAYGAADSHHRNLYNRMLWLAVKEKMLDKERMEALLRQSDADWTIVRPPALTEGPLSRQYRVGTDLRMGLTSKISYADVADCMLQQLTTPQYIRQAPALVAQRRQP